MGDPDFDFGTYATVARAALADRASPKRLIVHGALLCLLPAWALTNALCLRLDGRVFPDFRRVPVRAPVFVVGNARSGTTLFHRLLCADTERFTHFRAWEILLPSLVQKKLVARAAGAAERAGLRLRQRLGRWQDQKLAALREMHPTGLDAPEEDEFLMLIPFNSPVINVLFPYPERLDHLTRFDELPGPVRRGVMAYYADCVRRQLYLHGAGRTLVSKNPAFVTRMRSLREEFPDAKFVYLVRHPYETLPSLLKMLAEVWRGLGIDEDRIQRAARAITDGCIHNYRYALEVLDELPPASYAIVRYEDLVRDPAAEVRRVYARLGFEPSPAFEGILAKERARARGHSSRHEYALEEFGLIRSELRERLGDVLDRFGWAELRECSG